MLSVNDVNEMLIYTPETGDFVWRVSRGKAIKGATAGSINNKGYRMICIKGKSYQAHRLAWFIKHGIWPSHDIDHINRTKADNRISNLREATASTNMQNRLAQSNNTSGYRGVHWHKFTQKWEAQIKVEGKLKYIGRFDKKEDAYSAYQNAAYFYHSCNPHAAARARLEKAP